MTVVEVDGHRIELSNQDKVLFPGDGITKGDLVDYLRRVAELMLPHLRDRPLVVRRFPDGIGEQGFFHKDVPDSAPEWLRTVRLDKKAGGSTIYAVCDDEATLVYLANLGSVELHTLLAPAGDTDHPDQLVLDLDPPGDDAALVVAGARAAREVLERAGITSRVKATGSLGLHITVRLDGDADFDTSREVARLLADAVVERDPDRFTVAVSKEERGDRLFVDWLRNSYGQHAVAPYSVRALPGAPVAMPLDWDEATSSSFDPRRYSIGNAFRRLAQKDDPWAAAGRRTYRAAELHDRLARR